MKTESEIAADKLDEAAYTRGKIDGAKAERERAERILKETLTQIGKEFGQTPHLHTYAEFERRYLESLRGQHEGGQRKSPAEIISDAGISSEDIAKNVRQIQISHGMPGGDSGNDRHPC
jgi:hypothetical protein